MSIYLSIYIGIEIDIEIDSARSRQSRQCCWEAQRWPNALANLGFGRKWSRTNDGVPPGFEAVSVTNVYRHAKGVAGGVEASDHTSKAMHLRSNDWCSDASSAHDSHCQQSIVLVLVGFHFKWYCAFESNYCWNCACNSIIYCEGIVAAVLALWRYWYIGR